MQVNINKEKIIEYVKEHQIETIVGVIFVITFISIVSTFFNNSAAKNTSGQNISTQPVAQSSSQSSTNPSLTTSEQKPNIFNQVASLFGLQSKPTPETMHSTVSSEQFIPAGNSNGTNSVGAGITSSEPTGNAYPSESTGVLNTNFGKTGTGGSQTGQNNAGQSGTGNGGATGNSQQMIYPTLPPVTDVQFTFIDNNGTYETYVPPNTPPIDVTWMRYINHQDHYAIDYPSDWFMVKSYYNGHEGVTFYMPGGDPNNIDKPSIAFVGWRVDYLTSSANYSGRIMLNGIPGTIYTNGPLGISTIAAVFQPGNKYFAIGSSTSNSIFIYVFDHMLRSLDFNVQ